MHKQKMPKLILLRQFCPVRPFLVLKSRQKSYNCVKIALPCTILLSVETKPLLNKTTIAIDKVKSTKFPPIISPKEICCIPRIAAFRSTNKLGSEAANPITKNATINSLHLKYFATSVRDLINFELSQERIKQDARKIVISIIINYIWK